VLPPAGVLSLLLLMLAVVGVFIGIPFVSNYAFWLAIAAYVILDRGTNWPGMLSDLLLGLAVVGVFIDIPFVSQYAFWVAIAAYIIRLSTKFPKKPPTIRVGLTAE
jgi:hypothetical protein